MKIQWVLFIFLMPLVMQTVASESSEIVYQMETGFNLTEQSARQILSKYKVKTKQRVDYYADLYDGKSFLFDISKNHYKLRLKSTDSKSVIQANSTLRNYPSECQGGFAFDIREKNIGELTVNHQAQEKIVTQTLSILDQLYSPQSHSWVQSVKAFHQDLLMTPVPRLDILLTEGDGKKWILTPTHVSRKKKSKFSIPESDLIETSITESDVYIGTRFLQKTFEVEFQTTEENLIQPEVMKRVVCQFVQRHQFTLEDIHPVRIDPQAITLEMLKPYSTELLN